jgi:putative endonuclease
MERQRIGKNAEDAAVAFLEYHGLTILVRNYRGKVGELDIVARDGHTLVIVEVRTRASNRFGGAAASINLRKQAKIQRAAALLIQQRKELANLPIRFDVIAIRGTQIQWIKAAFTA